MQIEKGLQIITKDYTTNQEIGKEILRHKCIIPVGDEQRTVLTLNH